MDVPFTVSQFLEVFWRYNTAVWPAQIVFYGLALLMIYWAASGVDRWVHGLLAFLWAWMGVVYHWLFFTEINGAAWAFGALFLAQALVFLGASVGRPRIRFLFTRDVYGLTGAAFLAYALVLYPVLGAMAGHAYPRGPTLGLPCPSTIATFGLLLWTSTRVPPWVLAIPLVWAVIGSSAAVQFGITEDLGLLVAGLLGTIMLLVKNRRHRARELQPDAA